MNFTRTLTTAFLALTYTILSCQNLQDSRIVLINFDSEVDRIVSTLDKDELKTKKEEKLYDKFEKTVDDLYAYFSYETWVKHFGEEGIKFYSNETLKEAITIDELNHPKTSFIKRKIRKSGIATEADYFLSISSICSSPAVSVLRFRPITTFSIDLYDKDGNKVRSKEVEVKSEDKIGSTSFGGLLNVFSKIDMSFVDPLLNELYKPIDAGVKEIVTEFVSNIE